MTMHEEWTDTLSAYLDDDLPESERVAVEVHVQGCADCSAVLNDLKRVMALAQAAGGAPRAPQADLWPGIARRRPDLRPRLLTRSVRRWRLQRVSVTMGQLAAAVTLAAVSGGLVAQLMAPTFALPTDPQVLAARPSSAPVPPAGDTLPRAETVSFADDQYDAAVADLEKALKQGRGTLDASTIAIVEHNLLAIDQAIAQARDALTADPANSYLSSHLVDARRRKLDLLRRATAFTDMN